MKTTTETTATVILETRVTTKNGLHPIKLRVTHSKKSKYYILKYPKLEEEGFKEMFGQSIYLTVEDFKKTKGEKPQRRYKILHLMFAGFEKRATEEIIKLKPFTFEAFEEKYFDKPKDDQDVFAAITAKAAALRKDEKINTAITYECTLNSLKDFTNTERYPFANVTIQFLKNYEKWMLARKTGKNQRSISKTTVSMYLRCLKAIFNESAPAGIVYPFGKGKYMIPKWNHNKRALTQADVAKIAGYPAIDRTIEQRSRDLWLFSYLCNGINFKDIANLKYSNIKGDTIVFSRAKTEDDGEEIIVIITRQIGRIIDRWGCKPALSDRYIFDILKAGMTAEQKHRAIQQVIQTTNKYMKRICTDLEIPQATTYVARHSFASVLKRSGASVEYISESLGHKNISTTQNYLSNFEIEEKRKWAGKLLPETNS